mmetsp:Transcript_54175/g.110526  ORF Transcript_54175/g.110526 Transcript_54175/m.110526 type:complete len:305 (-) Transcript_54175:300-1214(-)
MSLTCLIHTCTRPSSEEMMPAAAGAGSVFAISAIRAFSDRCCSARNDATSIGLNMSSPTASSFATSSTMRGTTGTKTPSVLIPPRSRDFCCDTGKRSRRKKPEMDWLQLSSCCIASSTSSTSLLRRGVRQSLRSRLISNATLRSGFMCRSSQLMFTSMFGCTLFSALGFGFVAVMSSSTQVRLVIEIWSASSDPTPPKARISYVPSKRQTNSVILVTTFVVEPNVSEPTWPDLSVLVFDSSVRSISFTKVHFSSVFKRNETVFVLDQPRSVSRLFSLNPSSAKVWNVEPSAKRTKRLHKMNLSA